MIFLQKKWPGVKRELFLYKIYIINDAKKNKNVKLTLIQDFLCNKTLQYAKCINFWYNFVFVQYNLHSLTYQKKRIKRYKTILILLSCV